MFRGLSKLKSDPPPSHEISVSRLGSETKNELAITPPKRIIRALYPYTAQHEDELSFEKNSFFYVNEDLSGEWYLAFDPLKNVKGLVPQTYFEIIQRQDQQPVAVSQARKAHSRSGSTASFSAARLGFGRRSSGPEIITRGSRVSSSHHGPSNSTSTQGTSHSSRRSSLTLYGLVLYDFQAERNDELTVTAGESIVIVAQSTDEWFVAKPIGRLGGPGLIPVSYVELREVGTDQKLEDVNDAIKRANLPQVEEWKRRLAEYKASSIPLGRFGNTSDQVESSQYGSGSSASANGHSRSVSAALSAYSNRSDLSHKSHRSQPSNASYSAAHTSNAGTVAPGPAAAPFSGVNSNHYPPHYQYAHHHDPQYLMKNHATSDQLQTNNGAAKPQRPFMVSASVDRFAVNGGRYWYLVKVELSDGTHRNLCRFYQDFYDFQIKLLEQFPEEAGRTGKTRTLPFMPGPLTLVTHTVSSQRRANLDDYVRDLIRMPPHISQSEIVLDLFSVRPGDVESNEATQQLPQPPESGDDEQYSGDMPEPQAASYQSQYSAVSQQPSQNTFQPTAAAQQRRPDPDSTAEHVDNMSISQNPYLPHTGPLRTSNHQSSSSHEVQNSQQIYGSLPGGDKTTPVARSDIKLDQPTLKIKLFTSENVIAIRIPVETPFDEIHEKIKARLSVPDPKLYSNSSFDGEPIDTAEDFARALNGGTKIALYLKP